jgi:thioredoxin-like negative regulator of GroEL
LATNKKQAKFLFLEGEKMKKMLSFILIAAMSLAIVSCSQKEPQLPKVVKIGRTDCLPCVDLSKTLKFLQPEIEGKANIEIINLEDDPGAFDEYGLEGIPTLIFYDKNGNESSRSTGGKDAEFVLEMLKKAGMK